jgi:hypothetical protein
VATHPRPRAATLVRRQQERWKIKEE